jgi:hypothetical protein
VPCETIDEYKGSRKCYRNAKRVACRKLKCHPKKKVECPAPPTCPKLLCVDGQRILDGELTVDSKTNCPLQGCPYCAGKPRKLECYPKQWIVQQHKYCLSKAETENDRDLCDDDYVQAGRFAPKYVQCTEDEVAAFKEHREEVADLENQVEKVGKVDVNDGEHHLFPTAFDMDADLFADDYDDEE